MTTVVIRPANAADLPTIIRLIADDQLGATREDPSDLAPYERAFAAIDADPNQLLAVADHNGTVVGTLQLTIIPGLSHRGSSRGQIEAVRIAASERGSGLGTTMIEWAVDESRARGCTLVQLTSDKTRTDAHRFYDRLGFKATHEGYKLRLN